MKAIEWYPWAHLLKANEGGPGAAIYVRELKRHGVRAQAAHSIYVGHVLLEIEKGTLAKARKIIRRAFGKEWFL